MVKQSKESTDRNKVFSNDVLWLLFPALAALLSCVVGLGAWLWSGSGDPVQVELLSTDQLRSVAIAVFVFGALCAIFNIVGIVKVKSYLKLVSIMSLLLCLVLLWAYYGLILDAQTSLML